MRIAYDKKTTENRRKARLTALAHRKSAWHKLLKTMPTRKRQSILTTKDLCFCQKKGAVFLLFVNPDKRFLGYNAQACSLLFSFTHFICGMSNRFARGNIVWECHLKWSFEASGNVFSLRPKVTQFNIIQFDNILFSYKGESVLQICPSDHSKLNTWSNIISYCRKAKLTDENIKSKLWVYLRKLRNLFSSNFDLKRK